MGSDEDNSHGSYLSARFDIGRRGIQTLNDHVGARPRRGGQLAGPATQIDDETALDPRGLIDGPGIFRGSRTADPDMSKNTSNHHPQNSQSFAHHVFSVARTATDHFSVSGGRSPGPGIHLGMESRASVSYAGRESWPRFREGKHEAGTTRTATLRGRRFWSSGCPAK